MGSVVQVDQYRPSRSVMDEAVATLAFGGVLVLPTDSVYGIGCAATPGNPAHERIFAIKHRERSQTLPWLIADPSDLGVYGQDVPDYAVTLAVRYWPGALTLIVKASPKVPPAYRSAEGTIGLRMPDDAVARAIIGEVGCPLATTSANHSGQPDPHRFADIDPLVLSQVAAAIDDDRRKSGIGSTVIDCTGPQPRILRAGALTQSDINAALSS